MINLEKLTKEQLLEMINDFEYYPAVTEDDDRAYILAYLEDEACGISQDDIKEYLENIEITKDNIHLY